MQRHFGNLLLYISMFPQLIAGPIVRYNTVAQEISNRSVTSKDVADGIYRFVIGLGKKVILANQLSEISDQFLAGNMQDLTTTGAWTGIVAFTLQIYFDFSGYSDMAIGPIVVIPSPTSGDGGISRWVASSVTMCISLWAATAAIRP